MSRCKAGCVWFESAVVFGSGVEDPFDGAIGRVADLDRSPACRIEAPLAVFVGETDDPLRRPEPVEHIDGEEFANHFGDLEPAFEAAANALKDDGLFIFTLFSEDESREIRDFAVCQNIGLARSGCYAHSADYVVSLAGRTGFFVETLEPRIHEYHEHSKPIMGHLVALRRRARSANGL